MRSKKGCGDQARPGTLTKDFVSYPKRQNLLHVCLGEVQQEAGGEKTICEAVPEENYLVRVREHTVQKTGASPGHPNTRTLARGWNGPGETKAATWGRRKVIMQI